MPGIAEFLAESPYKLIIAELPDGDSHVDDGQHDHARAAFHHHAAHRGTRRRQPVPSTGSDPSRSFSFAFGTALPAPYLPFAIPVGIGSVGWISAVPDLHGL
jgi:hypothetical protein